MIPKQARELSHPLLVVLRDKSFKLNLKEIILGRAADAHIFIPSALASRRHARILVSASGPMLEDLQSRNGTFINSAPIHQPTLLRHGDTISIADEALQVMALSNPENPQHPTLAAMPRVLPSDAVTPNPPESGFVARARGARAAPGEQLGFGDEDTSIATRAADVFELLGAVADKMFTLGRQEEAERLLGSHLQSVLREARTGAELSDSLCQKAGFYALRLAEATDKAEWLDYIVELYSARRVTMPLHTVERCYTLTRRIRGINLTALKSYITLLASQSHTLKPAERFALQRLEGLQRSLPLL